MLRPVRTRFRCASAYRLRLAAQGNSLTHYAKGTPSPARDPEGSRRAPTARGHPVSGSLSPPSSGCFSPFPHGTGSLSVAEEYLGLGGGPPAFGQDFTCPALLWGRRRRSPVRACHPLWGGFPAASGSAATAAGLVPVRSPLLGESRLMSFPPGTEMFQFPGFASGAHGFGAGCRACAAGCPIRIPPDQSPLAAPRGLSQRAASFIASRRLGIHRVPFSRSPRPGGRAAGDGLRAPSQSPRTTTNGTRRAPRASPREVRAITRHTSHYCCCCRTRAQGMRARASSSRRRTIEKSAPAPPAPPPPACRLAGWWARADSNGRPRAYQARALTC